MRRKDRDIDVARALVQRIKVFRKALPLPGKPLLHHHAGDILDTFHGRAEQVTVGRTTRGKADAAIAKDHRGHSVRG